MNIIAFFDLETTGLTAPRIVEFGAGLVEWPYEPLDTLHFRCNPGKPIDPLATEVHGITDAAVTVLEPFAAHATEVLDFLDRAQWLSGFNVARYDIGILAEELARAGHPWQPASGRILDAMTLYHKLRPRTLEACYREFVGGEFNAHSALDDAEAAALALAAMVAEVGMDTPEALAEFAPTAGAEYGGVLTMVEGRLCFNVGKYAKRAVTEVVRIDRGYLQWALGSDFPYLAKMAIKQVMSGHGANGNVA